MAAQTNSSWRMSSGTNGIKCLRALEINRALSSGIISLEAFATPTAAQIAWYTAVIEIIKADKPMAVS